MEIYELIQNIAYYYERCPEFSALPFRFRTAITKDEIIFNRENSMDLKWLNGKPVVHIEHTETNLQKAIFIEWKQQMTYV